MSFESLAVGSRLTGVVLIVTAGLFTSSGARVDAKDLHSQPPAGSGQALPGPQPGGAPAPTGPGQPGPSQPGPRGPVAPPRDAGPAPPVIGRSVIRGRVVTLDSGTPLRRVQIRIIGSDVRAPRIVMTDAQGLYEIKELPAGRYQLTATKGGYVQLFYGQRRPLDPGRPIELADGQTLEKVDFHLPRGGVIAGRVVDEFGDPVPDASVTAMNYRHLSGRRRLVPAGRPGTTNDIGQYRLYGLPPGEYYLAAGLYGGMMMEGTLEVSQGYAPTYFPGTSSLADAQRVTVSIGDELNADLQLVPTRVVRITGTVADASGRPVTSGFVSLQSRDASLGMTPVSVGNGGPLRSDGTFSLSSVAPGSYYLTAMSMGPGGFGPMSPREIALLPIIVAGQDIDNVRLVTSRGATVKGRVIYDGGAPQAGTAASGATTMAPRVSCQAAEPDGPIMMSGTFAPIEGQGEFELTGLYVPCYLRIFSASPGWRLKSVLHDRQDITDRPLNFKAADSLSGVEIILTNRMTTVTGTVTGDDNRPTKDYVVVAFAEDREKLGFQSRYVQSGRPDQQGQFKIVGLPPGEYLLVALDSLEQGAEFDLELLDRLRSAGVTARLSEDAPRTIDLKLSTITP